MGSPRPTPSTRQEPPHSPCLPDLSGRKSWSWAAVGAAAAAMKARAAEAAACSTATTSWSFRATASALPSATAAPGRLAMAVPKTVRTPRLPAREFPWWPSAAAPDPAAAAMRPRAADQVVAAPTPPLLAAPARPDKATTEEMPRPWREPGVAEQGPGATTPAAATEPGRGAPAWPTASADLR